MLSQCSTSITRGKVNVFKTLQIVRIPKALYFSCVHGLGKAKCSTVARASMFPVVEKQSDSETTLSFSFEPFYRVILLYSDWDNDKSIAKKISKAVPIVSSVYAVQVARRCRLTGQAIVVTVIKDDAILYMSNLRNQGLRVTIDEA